MRIRVLYHDHCFDGAAAAAFFTRFLREKFHPGAEFLYTGMMHKASQIFEDLLFDGDVNAIVDFKYSSHPRLDWWFDHHQSAFLSSEDADHFHSRPWDKKFYDPDYRSCTMFISDIARERFGFSAPDLDELVRWADIIDGAQYANAREAVELTSPAAKLVLIIEGVEGSDIVQKIIRLMSHGGLGRIFEEPDIRRAYEPLYQRHLETIDVIGKEARENGRVVYFDLTGYAIEGYNKFIPYCLFPDSVYTVSVLISSFRTKVSVGSNPWAPEAPLYNLATICERYGGGGHPRVGAISFEKNEIARAREIATEIARELAR